MCFFMVHYDLTLIFKIFLDVFDMRNRIEEKKNELSSKFDEIISQDKNNDDVAKELVAYCQEQAQLIDLMEESVDKKIALYGVLYLSLKSIKYNSETVASKLKEYKNDAKKYQSFFTRPQYTKEKRLQLHEALKIQLDLVEGFVVKSEWSKMDSKAYKASLEAMGSIALEHQRLVDKVKCIPGSEEENLGLYGYLFLCSRLLLNKTITIQKLQELHENNLEAVRGHVTILQAKGEYFQDLINSDSESIEDKAKYVEALASIKSLCAEVDNCCDAYIQHDLDEQTFKERINTKMNSVFDTLNEHRGSLKIVLCNLLYALATLLIGYAIHALVAGRLNPLDVNTDTFNKAEGLQTAVNSLG